MASKERQYLTAIGIQKGIIGLIEDDGTIGYYRQRGIQRIETSKRAVLIKIGALDKDWASYKELPPHYSISFEDPDIMGRARASFPDADLIINAAKANARRRNTKWYRLNINWYTRIIKLVCICDIALVKI